jgi:hypothetical protein
VKVLPNYLFSKQAQVIPIHLQVVSIHLWGESFTPLGDARKLHPYKPQSWLIDRYG